MMCADGYQPLVIEGELDFSSNSSEGLEGSSDVPLSYFTCCPPQHLLIGNSTDIVRQCSDPFVSKAEWDNVDYIDTLCDDWDNTTNARFMKPNGMVSHRGMSSFVCCESSLTDEEYIDDDPDNDDYITHTDATISTEEDFLETLECVPYRNEFYQASNAQNQIGATNAQNQVAMLRPISCDMPNNDFMVPSPFGNCTMDDVAATGRYQCCRSGQSLPPFATDSAFKITLYPAFVLFAIATVLSALAAIALLLPLLVQLCNGTYQKAANTPGQEPRYSTYNLYLVYLMGVDLVYCLFQTSLYGMTIRQKFFPGFHGFFIPPTIQDSLMLDPLVEQPYYFASLWLNCVISYEVLLLLKSSERGIVPQPSLLRVNAQAGVVCIISMLIGSSGYFIEHAIQTAEINGNDETRQILMVVFLVFGTLLGLPPIFYTLNGACIVWWRGYIPSLSAGGTTPTDRARRDLAFFFFRIVLVYLAVWLPVIGLFLHVSITDEIWIYAVTNCLLAIEPTLTFGMILTKPDARKYIVDLLTLSCLCGKNSCVQKCSSSLKEEESLPTHNSHDKKKAETRNRSTTRRTTRMHDSYLESSHTTVIRDSKASSSVGALASPESGRYVYTSRRIPGRPAAILPTGEMVSVTESTLETPRTNSTENSDDSQ